MPKGIKTKTTVKDIKILDKAASGTAHMKNAFIRSKSAIQSADNAAENTQQAEHNSPASYATDRVTDGAKSVTQETAHRLANPHKKVTENVNKAKEQFQKARQQMPRVRKEAAEKAKQTADNAIKTADTLKGKADQAQKTAQTAQKSVQEAKHTFQQTRQAGRQTVQVAKQNVKTAKQAEKTIKTVGKTAAEMAEQYGFSEQQKAQLAELLSDKYADLWRAVLYGIHNGSGDIVEVAISQIGNVNGEPYWSWYGWESRVAWCACFVSWCANECGYIEAGIIPMFAWCPSGVQWFKDRGLWQDSSYTPAPGDIIFFDWEQDGECDHVGIVEYVEGDYVHTVEGNTSNSVARRTYWINSNSIYGYGTPLY